MSFNNADELKDVFDLDNLSEYYDYIPFNGKIVGFSIKRNYPSNIRYKPPIVENGTPETVALIKIYYIHPDESDDPVDPQKVPVNFSISPYTKTPLTLRQVRKDKIRPIGLDLMDECYYNHSAQTFFNSKQSSISGKHILDTLFEEHCDTVHPLRGFKLRFKLGIKNVSTSSVKLLIKICKWILRYPLGRVLESKDSFAGFATVYQKEDMKKLETEVIELHGIKASKNIAITFSILIVIGFFIVKILHINIPFLPSIFSNGILMICSSIILISILDYLFPRLFLNLTNLLIKLHVKVMLMNFKS